MFPPDTHMTHLFTAFKALLTYHLFITSPPTSEFKIATLPYFPASALFFLQQLQPSSTLYNLLIYYVSCLPLPHRVQAPGGQEVWFVLFADTFLGQKGHMSKCMSQNDWLTHRLTEWGNKWRNCMRRHVLPFCQLGCKAHPRIKDASCAAPSLLSYCLLFDTDTCRQRRADRQVRTPGLSRKKKQNSSSYMQGRERNETPQHVTHNHSFMFLSTDQMPSII